MMFRATRHGRCVVVATRLRPGERAERHCGATGMKCALLVGAADAAARAAVWCGACGVAGAQAILNPTACQTLPEVRWG